MRLLLPFMLIANTAFSQLTTISGTVVDEIGEPVDSATVKLLNTSAVTLTDEFGIYNFNVEGKGYTYKQPFTVTVSKSRFRYYSNEIFLQGDALEEISLKKANEIFFLVSDKDMRAPVAGAKITCTKFNNVSVERSTGVYSIVLPENINIYEPLGFIISEIYPYYVGNFDTIFSLSGAPPIIKIELTKLQGDNHFASLISEFEREFTSFTTLYKTIDSTSTITSWSKCLKLYNSIRDIEKLSKQGKEEQREFLNTYSAQIGKYDTLMLRNYINPITCNNLRSTVRINEQSIDNYVDSINTYSNVDYLIVATYFDSVFYLSKEVFELHSRLSEFDCQSTKDDKKDLLDDLSRLLERQGKINANIQALASEKYLPPGYAELRKRFEESYERNKLILASIN